MTDRVYAIDPLADSRWDDLVARHPRASIFHSRGWLEALRRTYGYEPFALTTTAVGPLANGLVACRVRTWLARRLVSLPFSDHCDPLVDDPGSAAALVAHLGGEAERHGWRSCEVRPRRALSAGLVAGEGHWLHTLDIARPAAQVFKGFHPSSTQRAIRRAEREQVSYEVGRSESLLAAFFELLRMTRRRHGLPPQPIAWFRNLVTCLGEQLAIHVARKDGRPIAALVTLVLGRSMVYKYGGSDAAYHPLGGMPFLFWRAIEGAQSDGLEELDLGRTAPDQAGLLAFKNHLGATRTPLTYYVWPAPRGRAFHSGALTRIVRRALVHMPDAALDLSGRLAYRHLG